MTISEALIRSKLALVTDLPGDYQFARHRLAEKLGPFSREVG